MKDTAPPYRPGMDRKSAHKTIWQRHWEEFKDGYPEQFNERYGDLPEQ